MSINAIPKATVLATRRRASVVPIACGLVLLAVLVLVIAGQALAPHDPLAQDPQLSVAGSGDGHLLGTDQLGRDVLSQIFAGTRASILGPFAVAVGCMVIGCTLGLVGAFHGGVTDTVVTRFSDLVYALPGLLVAIVLVGLGGGGYWITAAALLVLTLPFQIRLARSVAMVQVRLPYVDAARTVGLSASRTMFRHVLPNIMPTVVATFLLDFVAALIGFASLSYLGFGVPASSPDWGRMLSDGQSLVSENPWLSIGPATMLILTAASATLLGDWAYERLSKIGERP